MSTHVDPVLELLRSTGRPVYFVDVPEKPAPGYFLVWSTSGLPPEEQAVEDVGDFSDRIGVTAVALEPLGVLMLQREARAVLAGARPTVPGRAVWLTLADSRPIDIDRDVVPAVPYGVDLYDLVSVPA